MDSTNDSQNLSTSISMLSHSNETKELNRHLSKKKKLIEVPLASMSYGQCFGEIEILFNIKRET